MSRREAGFTLVEVLVALTLGAALVLAAHSALGGATDAVAALDRERRAFDTEMTGRAELTRMIANLQPSAPGAVGFDGSVHQARFSTQLRQPDGTFALTTVRLHVHGGTLVAEREAAAGAATIASLPDVGDVTFDYLMETGAESRWVQGWRSPVSAPVAVRLRLLRLDDRIDTLLVVAGPRG